MCCPLVVCETASRTEGNNRKRIFRNRAGQSGPETGRRGISEKALCIGKARTCSQNGTRQIRFKGLIDVTLSFGITPTATLAIVNATFEYGTALNPIAYIGADAPADWTLTNEDTGLPVVIDSVTPNGNGNYEIAYSTGVTGGETIKLEVSKLGFEGEVTSVTV